MAESPGIKDSLLEKLNCSICLEMFTSPLTLNCGHTFCQLCIHRHWDNQEAQMMDIDCPVCRKVFETRPEPMKNLTLNDVLEQARLCKKNPFGTFTIPEEEKKRVEDSKIMCPRHNRVLSMYCSTEKRCICQECIVKGCKGHELELIEEERQKEEKKLRDVLHQNDIYREKNEGNIATLNQLLQDVKDSCSKIVSGVSTQFDQVQDMLNECSSLAKESIRKDERAAVGQSVANRELLQNHLKALLQHKKEAEKLLQSSDDAAFLQGLSKIAPPGSPPVLPDVPVCGTSQVDAVTTILSEVSNLLKGRLPNAIYPPMPSATCDESQASASPARLIPKQSINPRAMSELRIQMHKNYRNLTFEPTSANKYIHLSCQNTIAYHNPNSVVDNLPERFQTWQVLCTEGFSEGLHYWEVETTKFFMHVGVAYSCLPRTNGEENQIGRNPFSWSLQVLSSRPSAWHDKKEQKLRGPEYNKMAIRLDCTAGNLTFYGVKDGGLILIHSFNCIFKHRLYPVFWIGEDTTVKLLQK
uniref:Uncharacterized protein n=1 Tax=Leptobrachium leishanense TaxID=445787 RepID=A0A8C5R853_9ANUR